jgi:hypothetical protein
VFADLDETIRKLLIQQAPLDEEEVDVSFDAPDREWSGRLSRPTVNCFLYDVRENLEYRDTDWAVERQNGHITMRKPPARIDATYQVTVWARAPEDEHRLLWRILAALMRHQQLPEELLYGGLAEQVVPVRAQVAQPNQSHANPADLWQALDNRIRPALTYVLTLSLDTQVAFTSPIVFTRTARLSDSKGRETARMVEVGGRVRDKANNAQALAGARVQLRETGVQVITDTQGRFVFTHAPQGPVTLVARAPGRQEVTRSLTVPAPDYDLDV